MTLPLMATVKNLRHNKSGRKDGAKERSLSTTSLVFPSLEGNNFLEIRI